MGLDFAVEGSPEWDRAWDALQAEDGDRVRESQGEVWQYMGTAIYADGVQEYQFRHRYHPVTKAREYRYYREVKAQ